MKTITIKKSANELTEEYTLGMIKLARDQGYDELRFEWEPVLGPYLSIDLNDDSLQGITPRL